MREKCVRKNRPGATFASRISRNSATASVGFPQRVQAVIMAVYSVSSTCTAGDSVASRKIRRASSNRWTRMVVISMGLMTVVVLTIAMRDNDDVVTTTMVMR